MVHVGDDNLVRPPTLSFPDLHPTGRCEESSKGRSTARSLEVISSNSTFSNRT
jgi:hypothetical protein